MEYISPALTYLSFLSEACYQETHIKGAPSFPRKACHQESHIKDAPELFVFFFLYLFLFSSIRQRAQILLRIGSTKY